MIRLLLASLSAALTATAAAAQTPDPHAGHHMPTAPTADAHADHRAPPPGDPHAGHQMPTAAPADPHAGHASPVEPASTTTGAELPVGNAQAPPSASDHLADRIHGAAKMEAARDVLRLEHGGARLSRTMVDILEVRAGKGVDAYAWAGEFRYGGDIERLVLKSDLEGELGHELESAEVQALWSHAVGPYFDLQAGVRQDFQPRPRRTYAMVGFEGLAPYWFDVEGALFLSNKGDLSARVEGSYDLRLTNRLILQPSLEANLMAQDVPELGVGAGLSDAEVGLRLRYEIRREFAPYVGVHYERKFGETADLARAAGEGRGDLRAVAGLRIWF